MSWEVACWLLFLLNGIYFAVISATVKAYLRLKEDYEDVALIAARYAVIVKIEDEGFISLEELKLKYGRLEDQA